MTQSKWTTAIETVHSLLRASLGVIFLVSGVGKTFALAEFSETISSVGFVSPGVAYALAAMVIGAEITGGILLLMRRAVVIASVLLCGMAGLFVWVLYSAIIQDREFLCKCFGILNIHLPNHVEIIVDLMLFNVLGLTAALEMRTADGRFRLGMKGKAILLIGCGLLVHAELALIAPGLERARKQSEVDLTAAVGFVESRAPDFLGRKYGLLFVVSFHDLNCSLCFNDFIAISDSVKSAEARGMMLPVAAVFRPDGLVSRAGPSLLSRWAQGSGVSFPVFACPESVFVGIQSRKSFAALVRDGASVHYVRDLPLGVNARSDVLRFLTEGR